MEFFNPSKIAFILRRSKGYGDMVIWKLDAKIQLFWHSRASVISQASIYWDDSRVSRTSRAFVSRHTRSMSVIPL